MPSSTLSWYPDSVWVTTGSKPESEAANCVEGFDAGEETAGPELVHAQFGNLGPLRPNAETLLEFEVKMEFWLCHDEAGGDDVVKGNRTNVCKSFMVDYR